MESSFEKDKPWRYQLDSFLEAPTRNNLRELLQIEAIEERVIRILCKQSRIHINQEDDDLEFKRELLSFDLLAKHILAMANKSGDTFATVDHHMG